MRLIFDGDPQVGSAHQDEKKAGHPKAMLAELRAGDVVCYPGDLTHAGATHENLITRWCFRKRGDQWGTFKSEWVKPFEAAGINVLLCAGNHDDWEYGWRKPVLDRIRKHHNRGLKYCWRPKSAVTDSLNVVVCGIYPDDLEWLASSLHPDPEVLNIVVWHYTPDPLPFSAGWEGWGLEHQTKVREVLGNHNVVVVCGHHHDSYEHDWRGIRLFVTGGRQFLMITGYGNNFGDPNSVAIEWKHA